MDPGPAMMAGHGGSPPLPTCGDQPRLLAPRTPAGRVSSRRERRNLLVLGGNWSFVPILALQGVLFGRVAGYLEPRFRYLADFGAFVLFAVAATTTGVVLQSPGVTAFSQAWNLGFGILPAAALLGYVLIALGMTGHLAPVTSRFLRSTRPRPRGSSTERSLQVFR